ncbi:hypothetical protein AVEN_224477-1 [Araneus ventricosus]|uniref:Uncharacterized protein n=1 Tax=Araneus ventricosus TaxID=182803 RepID=A0A4Y2KHF2_ARAVE|nr:hypothetical protein AVEN_224477-1 [Araneus ventricosus]
MLRHMHKVINSCLKYSITVSTRHCFHSQNKDQDIREEIEEDALKDFCIARRRCYCTLELGLRYVEQHAARYTDRRDVYATLAQRCIVRQVSQLVQDILRYLYDVVTIF